MAPSASIAALTAYAFGISSTVGGAITLVDPQRILDFLGLASRARVATTGAITRSLGLAAVATGVFYITAGYQNNRTFLIISAPLRILTAGIFWREGPGPFRALGIWQGAGALMTAAGLLLDYNKQRVRHLRKRDKPSSAGGGGGGAVESDDVRETEGSEGEGKRKKSGRSRFSRKSKKSKDDV